MFEIKTEIEIGARAQDVWLVLTDLSKHAEWNPFIRSIEGRVGVGERLRISIQPPGGRGMTFRPVVQQVTPNREFRWLGRLFLPGLFDGEHYFEIQEAGPGRVHFVHGEKFSGLLAPFIRSSLDTQTRAGFEAMNEALKRRLEYPGV